MSKGNPNPVGRFAAYEAQAARRPPKEVVIEALKANAGIITASARALGISAPTLRKIIKEDADIQEAQKDIRQEWTDIAEAALLKNIKSGRSEDIRFYLRCFGADRGYVEVTRVAGADGGALKVEHQPTNMLAGWELSLLDEEELDELKELVKAAQTMSLTNDQNTRLQELRSKACPVTIDAEPVRPALPSS